MIVNALFNDSQKTKMLRSLGLFRPGEFTGSWLELHMPEQPLTEQLLRQYTQLSRDTNPQFPLVGLLAPGREAILWNAGGHYRTYIAGDQQHLIECMCRELGIQHLTWV